MYIVKLLPTSSAQYSHTCSSLVFRSSTRLEDLKTAQLRPNVSLDRFGTLNDKPVILILYSYINCLPEFYDVGFSVFTCSISLVDIEKVVINRLI